MIARTINCGIKKTKSFTGFPFICLNNLGFDDRKNQYIFFFNFEFSFCHLLSPPLKTLPTGAATTLALPQL
jgi:hypothetical protein